MTWVLVDFDTHMGRDFDAQVPIGVWVTRPDGGVDLRYLTEVTEGDHPGFDNYLRTYQQLEEHLDAWRAGTAQPDFEELLQWVTETAYLGFKFSTLAEFDEEISLDEAFDRFVVNGEPLPVPEWLEEVQIG